MKRFMKVSILLVLAISLLISMLACTKADVSTMSKIESEGKLIMGTNAEFKPFEYHEIVDGKAQIVGFDIDLSQIIADKLGVELVIEEMDFDGLIPALEAGQLHLIAAGMTETPARAESVNFSIAYFNASQVIIIKEDNNDIKGKSDLKGKTLGVQLGTTGDEMATEEVGDKNVIRFNKAPEAIMDLLAGRIDAVILDQAPAAAYVTENEGLIILDEPLTVETYSLASKKGDDEFTELLNQTIIEIKVSGEYDALLKKYALDE